MPARATSPWAIRDHADQLARLAAIASQMTRPQLQAFAANLDPSNLAILEQAVGEHLALGWRSDPAAMASHLTRGETHNRWAYVRLLSAKFRQAVRGESRRQIWNVPARYGKSTISSRWGPIWCMDDNPKAKLIITSYADTLADEHAVFVRDTAEQHADQLRFKLRRDRRRADRFVTDEGGGLMAAGIRSGITGFGAGNGGGIVVDDPFKDWVEAHSPTTRTLVWNQYRSVLRLRLDSDDDWIIVVHTRWHDEDLTGMLLRASEDETGEPWELVRLPAIAESPSTNPLDPEWLRMPDPLGRDPGQVLEPERFSDEGVRLRARVLGSYLAAGLEQQRPAPEEGTELMRGWWKMADTLPPTFDDAITSWDVKGKDKETGDFAVGQVWGRTGPDVWLAEQLRGQFTQLTCKMAVCLLAIRHPYVRRHYVENTGYGPEVIADLQRGDRSAVVTAEHAGALGMTDTERIQVERLLRSGLGAVLPVTPKGSKQVRARAQSGQLEAGHVHVLANDLGGLALIEEAASFPNGTTDDMVDAWSQAMAKLARSGSSVQVPQGQRAEPRPGGRLTSPVVQLPTRLPRTPWGRR